MACANRLNDHCGQLDCVILLLFKAISSIFKNLSKKYILLYSGIIEVFHANKKISRLDLITVETVIIRINFECSGINETIFIGKI